MKHVYLYAYAKVIMLCFVLAVFTAKVTRAQYTKLKDWDNIPGVSSTSGSVTLSGNVLYGMAGTGGANNFGSIFKINIDGSGFTRLVDFDGVNKGRYPNGSLILAGSVLYGMTSSGGVNDLGIIFKVNVDGSGYTKLADFNGINKGSTPRGNLILAGNILYGMANAGGAVNAGTIFKVNTDGTGFTKIIDFNPTITGSLPGGSLILSNDVLYGTTSAGGAHNGGTVFCVKTDGSLFKKLVDFDAGAITSGSLTISNNVL